ncbi:hypothetical protein Tco_0712782 [Tanacetum coccineum]
MDVFDLELLTPSMNYIPVRKENYADSGGNVSTHDDVDDLDDQQFIVHDSRGDWIINGFLETRSKQLVLIIKNKARLSLHRVQNKRKVYVDVSFWSQAQVSYVKDFEAIPYAIANSREDVNILEGRLGYLSNARRTHKQCVLSPLQKQRICKLLRSCLLLRLKTILVLTACLLREWFNDVSYTLYCRAVVAGKRLFEYWSNHSSWTTLYDDAHGVRLLSLSKWKYLVHVLLHCLSPKSTSWEQFGTNIASALVGLATNQKFNFSLMILNGMLGHISNGTPFLMYPRHWLAEEEIHESSPHSRAASSARDAHGTPTQSAAQASLSHGTADVQGTDHSMVLLSKDAVLKHLEEDEGLLDLYAFEQGKLETQEANPFSS